MTMDNGQGDDHDDTASTSARILREQLQAINSLLRTCEQIQMVLDSVSHGARLGLLKELYGIARDAGDAFHALAVLVDDLRRADGGAGRL